MSIKDHALLVRLSVNKPQMTQKDDKATADAEEANNARGAGVFRKDLYPKHLVAPIVQVEAAARAYIDRTTYDWNRSESLLPMARFMDFTDRIGKFEIEFKQSVTAFLNNWSNVMLEAQARQGALFDASAYPDTTSLKDQFRFRVLYRPVTDINDFRVQCQEEELDLLRKQVQESTREEINTALKAPLVRLKEVLTKLHEVTGKTERETIDKRTGRTEIKPPIFRDSVVGNIMDEIALLHDFAAIMPGQITSVAKRVTDIIVPAQTLRDDPEVRKVVNANTGNLLATIDSMLED